MFGNFSLRLKLVLAFLAIAALLVVVSVYQIMSMHQFSDQLNTLVNQDMAVTNSLQDMELASTQVGDRRVDYLQALSTTDIHNRTLRHTALVAQTDDFEHKLKTYEELTKAADTTPSSQVINAITASGSAVLSATRTITASSHSPSQTDLTYLEKLQAQLDQLISSATSAQRHDIQEKANEIIKVTADRQFTVGMMAILFIIMAGVTGIMIASRIGRSLALLGGGAERIANGDFSQTIDGSSHDEIGQVGATFNRMAQRLRDSYHRLALEQQRDEAILQGMSEGLIVTDEKGNIVVTNNRAGQLLEFKDKASVIGKPINEAYSLYNPTAKKDAKPLSPDQRPGLIALSTGKPVDDVYAFHGKNGAVHQINVAASPVTLEGKVVGAVTILRDVTREKEIDRMKTEFISLASHQLRTPLSAIKWFTEMLLNGDAGNLKDEQLEFAHNIADSTERMIALVSSLLNISRIESGRIMIVPKPTDLHELVGGIINDLKAKTEEKEQTLIISVHEDLPKINLDPQLIGQVFLNLLTNAIKYTPKGGEISVFISKKDDMVVSQVADNGYGIPKEQQARVFEKFFRAANAVKIETDGTGLGLYLIKAIVESSGGRIWFESEEGKGTTFWFTIPLSGMKPKEGEVTLDA